MNAVLAKINVCDRHHRRHGEPRRHQPSRAHQRRRQDQYHHRRHQHVGAAGRTRLVGRHHQCHQSAHAKCGVIPAQTLTFTVGAIRRLDRHLRHRRRPGQTLAELNTALAGLAGGIASVDPLNGNITVTASNSTDTITVGGDATALNFGIHTTIALPSNGTVVANDVTHVPQRVGRRRRHHGLRHRRLGGEHPVALGQGRLGVARRRPYRHLESVLSDRFERDRHRSRPGRMPASTTPSAPMVSSIRRSIRSRCRM